MDKDLMETRELVREPTSKISPQDEMNAKFFMLRQELFNQKEAMGHIRDILAQTFSSEKERLNAIENIAIRF